MFFQQKFRLLTTLIGLTFLTLLFYVYSLQTSETANVYEKEWCIDTFWKLYGDGGASFDGYAALTISFHESISKYENKSSNEINSGSFRMKLLKNDENYLEVCKIWYEVENID